MKRDTSQFLRHPTSLFWLVVSFSATRCGNDKLTGPGRTRFVLEILPHLASADPKRPMPNRDEQIKQNQIGITTPSHLNWISQYSNTRLEWLCCYYVYCSCCCYRHLYHYGYHGLSSKSSTAKMRCSLLKRLVRLLLLWL